MWNHSVDSRVNIKYPLRISIQGEMKPIAVGHNPKMKKGPCPPSSLILYEGEGKRNVHVLEILFGILVYQVCNANMIE